MIRSLKSYTVGAQSLILAAEKLIAERGISGAPVREILRAAGQANNSAIYHHFGSKDGLVSVIYDLRQAQADDARLARLANCESMPTDLLGLLRLTLLPILDTFRGEARLLFAKFVLRLVLDDPRNKRFANERQPETTRRLTAAMRNACPHLSDEMFTLRYSLAVLYFLQSIIYAGRLVETTDAAYPASSDFWNDILLAVCATMDAPFSGE